MSAFLGICTVVGFCIVAKYIFVALGKVLFWLLSASAALVAALLVGSVILAAITLVVLLCRCLFVSLA